MNKARAGGLVVCLGALAAMLSGASVLDRRAVASTSLDGYADRYLNLVADLGALSPESVDFLIDGKEKGKEKKAPRPAPTFASVAEQSLSLAAEVRATRDGAGEDASRAGELARQLGALALRSNLRAGTQVALAVEMGRLFAIDLSSVSDPADHGDAARKALARLLPGAAPLSHRLSEYQRRFIVPRGRLHAVITRSVAACRSQTTRFLALPEGEELAVEYVADRPWSGYSVYRGNFRSVMQVNRAMPLSIGQALNLACHEGYPGHHTYNALRDQHVVRGRNRPEARALLIFSPDGFYAEALAAAAASMVFSIDERSRLFREDLFPLVGLDPSEAETYAEVCALLDRLTGATTLAVRRYLSGELSAAEAATALERDALMEHPEGLLAYVDRYRGYALAYTWGRDRLLSNLTGPARGEEDRWRRLQGFLTSPPRQNDLFAARQSASERRHTLLYCERRLCYNSHESHAPATETRRHPCWRAGEARSGSVTRNQRARRVFQGKADRTRGASRAENHQVVRSRPRGARPEEPAGTAGPQYGENAQAVEEAGRSKGREARHAPP